MVFSSLAQDLGKKGDVVVALQLIVDGAQLGPERPAVQDDVGVQGRVPGRRNRQYHRPDAAAVFVVHQVHVLVDALGGRYELMKAPYTLGRRWTGRENGRREERRPREWQPRAKAAKGMGDLHWAVVPCFRGQGSRSGCPEVRQVRGLQHMRVLQCHLHVPFVARHFHICHGWSAEVPFLSRPGEGEYLQYIGTCSALAW